MPDAKILIAGIGNVFLGDDGFGSEVARRLAGRPLPEGVRVIDFGIRGLDLAFALTDGCDFAILVDATPQGGPPGTLYTIVPELDAGKNGGPDLMDGHKMDPVNVLRMASRFGTLCPRILLVGCEPADFGGAEGSMDLSQAVQQAVSEACALLEGLVDEFLREKAGPVGQPSRPGRVTHS